MHTDQRPGTAARRTWTGRLVVVLGFAASQVLATVTPHPNFDALIAELEVRSARTGGPDQVNVTFFASGFLTVGMCKGAGTPCVFFSVLVGDPGTTGTRTIVHGGQYNDGANAYTITGGSCTITRWPRSFPGRAMASFSFTGSGLLPSGSDLRKELIDRLLQNSAPAF